MNFIKCTFILAVTAMMTLLSCSDNEEQVNPGKEFDALVLLSQSPVQGTDLKLNIYQYSNDLITGYNRLEFTVEKEGYEGTFNNAEIALLPIMDMGTMMHACPVEQPIWGLNFDKAFGGAIVFVMPSSDQGIWELKVMVKDLDTGEEGEITLPLIVKLPDESKLKSFSIGDSKYFVSLIEPYEPQVGINDFEVTIHQKKTMMEWLPVSKFEIGIEPEMPDMGHGSPNNENPVHTEMGHYLGKVNFTMDGYWKVNLILDLNGVVNDLSFDLTFEHASNQ